MEKKKKWIRLRHQVVRNIVLTVLGPWIRLGLHADPKPFPGQEGRNWLILFNHQTPYDQFFVSRSFRKPVYYLASEDLFSKGWFSSLLRWCAAPIPIVKNTPDLRALRSCVQVAREGGNVGVAPEGNRTYSGKTEYMSPSIVQLVRFLKLPVALYRIEGGFGVQPRWSDRIRRGKIRAYVSRVLEPREYAEYSDERLFREIREGLAVNDCRGDGTLYRSARRAEYLERAAYVCPWCGLTPFRSSGSRIRCETCGREVEYGEDLRLTGVGFDFPFTWYTEWYDYQNDFVRSLDLTARADTPLFRDTADLYRVILRQERNLLRRNAALALCGDRITVDGPGGQPLTLPFREITAASLLGRNKMNLYLDDTVYQVKGGPRFNALKYVNFYYRWKAMTGDAKDGEFLGL